MKTSNLTFYHLSILLCVPFENRGDLFLGQSNLQISNVQLNFHPRGKSNHFWRSSLRVHRPMNITGKSLSEALVFASTYPYPQYECDDKIVQWITSSLHKNSKLRTCQEHVVYINCSECQNKIKTTNCVNNMFLICSELGIFMYWTGNSMNNLLSYCGLVVERIRASEKDLPVHYTALADGLANYFKMGRTNSWRNILIFMHLCFYTRIFNSFH